LTNRVKIGTVLNYGLVRRRERTRRVDRALR
jgi:hypothetical protein